MSTPAARPVLSRDDLERMHGDDRWLGFGYLQHRSSIRSSVAEGELVGAAANAAIERLVRMDADVLEEANAEGLSYDELFAWANSKSGRWFGDCHGSRHAVDYLPTRTRVAALLGL